MYILDALFGPMDACMDGYMDGTDSTIGVTLFYDRSAMAVDETGCEWDTYNNIM